MSNTSNFKYCVELALSAVQRIFHLAFKDEALFPHNVGPFERDLGGGLMATVTATVLDDASRPADVGFATDKELVFRIPNDVVVQIPDAPDPSLSRLTLSSVAVIRGRLESWNDGDGPTLGVTFAGTTAADVSVESLTGVPGIGIDNMLAAVHSRYDAVEHRHTMPANGGTAELLLYDGTRDLSLSPAAPGNPPITGALETHGGTQHLRLELPIHVSVPSGFGTYTYTSFGRIRFWRRVDQTDTSITVQMGIEPGDAALKTVVELDNTGPGHDQVVTALTPLAIGSVNAFGPITYPVYSQAAAEERIEEEIAAYIEPLKFPLYTPRTDEPDVVLTDPVGFLLPASDTLAILLTRRVGTAADDVAPDDFRGANEIALAVGRETVIESSDAVLQARFPGVNAGGADVHTPQGDATLQTCHSAPEDSGDHDETPGHLWLTGTAEVHIDCWPDPDVSFEGPIFVDSTQGEDEAGACQLTLQPRAGEFDVGQSCCDVLIDILIPVVGWIMIAVVESLIDDVGGELAQQSADATTRMLQPLPKVVVGVAEITCCLETLVISRQGFVFPGSLAIRRDGRSFEDMHDQGRSPRPDSP